MLVFFVRHGESENNVLNAVDSDAEYAVNRTPDPGLTERGVEAGCLCGKRLAEIINAVVDNPPATVTIWASPMKRAIASAEILASFLPRVDSIKLFDHIHEIGGLHKEKQVFPGLSPEEILSRERYQDRLPPIDVSNLKPGQGWWNCRPKETYKEAGLRAIKFVSDLKSSIAAAEENSQQGKNEPTKVLVIIGHGMFLDLVYKAMIYGPSKNDCHSITSTVDKLAFVTHNWGIGIFRIDKQGAITISCLNSADHIPIERRIPHHLKSHQSV